MGAVNKQQDMLRSVIDMVYMSTVNKNRTFGVQLKNKLTELKISRAEKEFRIFSSKH